MKARLALATALGLTMSQAAFAETAVKVGETYDACQRDNSVTVGGRDGQVSIAAETAGVTVRFASIVTDFHWYCGGERERSANDEAFNAVIISRSNTGAAYIEFMLYI